MNTLLAANLDCLRQGIELLQKLPESDYAVPCPGLFGSSIGGHMRHNLDHYAAFTAGLPAGAIDYDARQRDPAIERDPAAATALMRRLIGQLEALADADLERPLRIRMDDGGDSSWSASSLRRELQFLLSHTIHHYALIVSIATRSGFNGFPRSFGIAPSTLNHQRAGQSA
jgi:uncharacterized damage-inducible protein DinB